MWREARDLAAAKLQAAVRGQRVRRELWAEVCLWQKILGR